MEELTKAEERIMQVFWTLQKAFVKEVIDELDEEPKPPYNTISSIVRILEKKGFLSYQAFGKTYQYFPIIDKDTYGKQSFKKFFSNYFDNSATSLLSYMIKEENLNEADLEEIKKIINQNS